MITKNEIKVFAIKAAYGCCAKVGSYYLDKSVTCVMNKNYGKAEQYQAIASKCLKKQCELIDELMEITW